MTVHPQLNPWAQRMSLTQTWSQMVSTSNSWVNLFCGKTACNKALRAVTVELYICTLMKHVIKRNYKVEKCYSYTFITS